MNAVKQFWDTALGNNTKLANVAKQAVTELQTQLTTINEVAESQRQQIIKLQDELSSQALQLAASDRVISEYNRTNETLIQLRRVVESKLTAVTAEKNSAQEHLDATIDILEQTRRELITVTAERDELLENQDDTLLENCTCTGIHGHCLGVCTTCWKPVIDWADSFEVAAARLGWELAAHQEALKIAKEALEFCNGTASFSDNNAARALAKIEEVLK